MQQLVILFLSRKKFYAKQVFVLSSSLKTSPGCKAVKLTYRLALKLRSAAIPERFTGRKDISITQRDSSQWITSTDVALSQIIEILLDPKVASVFLAETTLYKHSGDSEQSYLFWTCFSLDNWRLGTILLILDLLFLEWHFSVKVHLICNTFFCFWVVISLHVAC